MGVAIDERRAEGALRDLERVRDASARLGRISPVAYPATHALLRVALRARLERAAEEALAPAGA